MEKISYALFLALGNNCYQKKKKIYIKYSYLSLVAPKDLTLSDPLPLQSPQTTHLDGEKNLHVEKSELRE